MIINVGLPIDTMHAYGTALVSNSYLTYFVRHCIRRVLSSLSSSLIILL